MGGQSDTSVSIHAPARGATWDKGQLSFGHCVSIHAPARGATRASLTSAPLPSRFNPRPCARGDCSLTARRAGRFCFNPRPCARGDPKCSSRYSRSSCFNPRPCARGDVCHFQNGGVGKVVSIHAPARGATVLFGLEMFFDGRFNPRPCARGDVFLPLPEHL